MKNCIHCGREIVITINSNYKGKKYVYNYFGKNNKFCSLKCYHSFYKGKPLTGKFLEISRESIKKAIDARKNNPIVREGWLEKMRARCGPKAPAWIKDRSKVVNQDERNCFKYLTWRKKVIIRDGYKCKLNNSDCDGCLEVHHIIAWRDDKKLHYKLSNGITLCHTHHPRIRSEEKRLIPVFKNLINN